VAVSGLFFLVKGGVMKNRKKVILMLGLALSIICGRVAWTMEPECMIFDKQYFISHAQEIKHLHKQISKEFMSLTSPIGSSWHSEVVKKDFLKMEPLAILDHLRTLIVMLNSSLKQIRKIGKSEIPAASMSPRLMKMYAQDLSVLEKVQKLYDLIKNACVIKQTVI